MKRIGSLLACLLASTLAYGDLPRISVRVEDPAAQVKFPTTEDVRYLFCYKQPDDDAWTIDFPHSFTAQQTLQVITLPKHLQDETPVLVAILPRSEFQDPFENVRPNIQYPLNLKKKRLQGSVVVRFLVKKDGTVGPIEVESSDHEDFTQAIITALRQMRGTPATDKGEPVEIWMQRKFPFSLS